MRSTLLEHWQKKFEGFSSQQTLLLALLLTERMLPNYRTFSQTYQFGEAEVLEDILLYLKNGLIGEEIENLLEMIEAQAPDTEDFGGILLASAALDAVAALYELVELYIDADQTHLSTICSLALNAPYMYLHLETENPYETESMQAEIALINRCIKQVQQDETIEVPENEWVVKLATE